MQPRQKLDALTSLRFFAAALIVALHTSDAFSVFNIEQYVTASKAVSFFFVLSGFILSYAYRQFNSTGSLHKFYVARFARLWPLHVVTAAYWLGVAYSVNPEAVYINDGLEKLFANLTLIQAWVPLQSWQASINAVSWSISVEVFFYLLFPFLANKFQTHWKHIFIAESLILIALIYIALTQNFNEDINRSSLLYFFPPARLFEFTAGIAAYHIAQKLSVMDLSIIKRHGTMVEVVALLVSASNIALSKYLAFGQSILGTGVTIYINAAWSALAFAFTILVFSISSGRITKMLCFAPLTFLGEASFALYLCHYPTIYLISSFPNVFGTGEMAYYQAWAYSIVLACILYKTIESPARNAIVNIYISKNKLKTIAIFAACIIYISSITLTSVKVKETILPENLFTTGTSDKIVFDCGATISKISVDKPYSKYAVFTFTTQSTCKEKNLMLAVLIHSKDGSYINTGAYKLYNKGSNTYTIKTQTPINNFMNAESLVIAAYEDVTALIPVTTPNRDASGIRAIVPVNNGKREVREYTQ
ncbi:acyltransferase family protein [Pseudomonas sp.]|uniref:acyltransferase family protein n=1 Tax=Pseudomonas sp. TaxID=306 RepID=UPI003BB60532